MITDTGIITMTDCGDFSWLARLLQVNDSAFPTGSYAHSYGFEQVVQLGLARDEESIASHIENHLWPMLIHFELPVVRFAQEAALRGNFAALIALDTEVDATKSPREIREASRATGRRRLHAFMANPPAVLPDFAQAVQDGRAQGHHAVVFGVGLAALPQRALLTSWAFQSLSAVCLSTPKLLRVGQDAAQRILTASLTHVEVNVEKSLTVPREEMGWFDPLTDIASMHHEIADERLFIS